MSVLKWPWRQSFPGREAVKREGGDVEMDSGGWKEIVISASVLGLAGWAGWLDWRFRRIPNWLTVPALLVGLILSAAVGEMAGVEVILGRRRHLLGCLATVCADAGVGRGRLEAHGSARRVPGAAAAIVVLLGTILIAGLMSVVEVVRQRKVRETLNNLVDHFCCIFDFSRE